MDVPSLTSSVGSRVVGLFAVLLFSPISVVCGVFTAYFAARQFISGWIPSQWFSDSALDWVFAFGTEGGAANYLGFMLSAVPTFLAGQAVVWGMKRLTGKAR